MWFGINLNILDYFYYVYYYYVDNSWLSHTVANISGSYKEVASIIWNKFNDIFGFHSQDDLLIKNVS